MSLIIDFLRKSLREEIFKAFFWVFYNQFFAHVSADKIFRVLLELFISEVVRK